MFGYKNVLALMALGTLAYQVEAVGNVQEPKYEWARETDPEKTCMTYGQILTIMKSLDACTWSKGTEKSLQYCQHVIYGLAQEDRGARPEFVNDCNTGVIAQAIFYGYPEVADACERIDTSEVGQADPSVREGLMNIIADGHERAAAEFANIIKQNCKTV